MGGLRFNVALVRAQKLQFMARLDLLLGGGRQEVCGKDATADLIFWQLLFKWGHTTVFAKYSNYHPNLIVIVVVGV